MKKTYSEKLKDPRWQKLRLEAMNRTEFMCELCQDSESTLSVHHKEYIKGREPWDYDIEQLAVLCESCHQAQHDEPDLLKIACSYLPLGNAPFISRDDLAVLIFAILGFDLDKDLSLHEKIIQDLAPKFIDLLQRNFRDLCSRAREEGTDLCEARHVYGELQESIFHEKVNGLNHFLDIAYNKLQKHAGKQDYLHVFSQELVIFPVPFPQKDIPLGKVQGFDDFCKLGLEVSRLAMADDEERPF